MPFAASAPLSAVLPLSSSDFIGRWMSQIAPAAEAVTEPKGETDSDLRQLEFASVELSLRNLLTFPFVKSAVEKGELLLHGAFFGGRHRQASGAQPQDRRIRAGGLVRPLTALGKSAILRVGHPEMKMVGHSPSALF